MCLQILGTARARATVDVPEVTEGDTPEEGADSTTTTTTSSPTTRKKANMEKLKLSKILLGNTSWKIVCWKLTWIKARQLH